MMKNKLPGKVAHVLAALLAFMMMLVMTAGCLVWLVNGVLTDTAMHESIALDSRVIDQQMARIEARVAELAQEHPFQVETVTAIVNRESVENFNREAIAWWTGLMQADPAVEAPAYDAGDVEAAVREDPVFQENTPSTRRRTVARDDIAYEVGRAVNEAVLPVRTDVLAIVLPTVLEKVDLPVVMNYLALVPQLCGMAAVVLALLVMLVMLRRVSKAALYIGAGLAGSGLCVIGVGLVLHLLGVTGMCTRRGRTRASR